MSQSLLLSTRFALILLSLLVGRCVKAQAPSNVNPLRQQLTQQGVRIVEDRVVTLPEPSLPDGLDATQQRDTVTRIAGRYGWKTFVRPSAVAPFVLQQAYVKDKQDRRVGHSVDLWFVAYGQLQDFDSEQLGEGILGPKQSTSEASGNKARELSVEELERVGIDSFDKNAERFIAVEFPLMNRVFVQAVGHARQSRSDESIIVAWELDSRFDRDQQLANRWSPIETTDLGTRQRGTARPYQGYGGYVKITQLADPQDALLFEAHIVFHEPEAWFSASNFLRSKTPLMVRENVDKLRRRLAKLKR